MREWECEGMRMGGNANVRECEWEGMGMGGNGNGRECECLYGKIMGVETFSSHLEWE